MNKRREAKMNTTKKVSNTAKQTNALGISVCTGNYPRGNAEGNSPTDTKKDLARQFRHEAYLQISRRSRGPQTIMLFDDLKSIELDTECQFRQTDPQQIALKEAKKEFQREVYRNVNERNMAYRAALKNNKAETAVKKQSIRQNKLKALVVKGTEIPFDVRRLKV